LHTALLEKFIPLPNVEAMRLLLRLSMIDPLMWCDYWVMVLGLFYSIFYLWAVLMFV